MRALLSDLVFTVRSLLRRPAFLLLSVATVGVGIGAATAVLSVVEAVLLRQPPLPEADRLVAVYSTNPSLGMDRFSVSYPDFADWTGRDDLFESASLYALLERDLAGDGDPQRLLVAAVHDGFFETLGSAAAAGRLLGPAEQEPGTEPTVVLSHGAWVRLFGGDPGVVGRTVRLDGVSQTVIGVAAEGQSWPRSIDAWVPLQFGSIPPATVTRRSNHRWQVIGRLQPGVTPDRASDQVRAAARAWYTANESGNEEGVEGMVVPLRATGPAANAGPLLGILSIAVLLVLLIASLNQAGLLLVHAWTRTRELSLRAALGAGRGRLLRLLMGESVLLAILGAGAGLFIAWLGIGGLSLMAPATAAGDIAPRLNGFVVTGAVILALVVALLAGLLPSLRAARASLATALKEGGAATGIGRSATRLRRGLVVLETALSVVLLTGAGLAIRAFQEQLDADTGIQAENVLIFDVRLPRARYGGPFMVNQYYDRALDRLAAVPGVTSASATSSLPLGASRYNLHRVFVPEGSPEPPAAPDFGAMWVEVDPEYFDVLGVRPVSGRPIGPEDRMGSTPVIMVNESMARLLAPDGDVLGRRIRSWRDENVLREVVGVMPDLQLAAMAGNRQPAVYVPRSQGEFVGLSFMVRTDGDPTALIGGVRSAMAEQDPDIALVGLQTLEAARNEGLSGIRVITTVFAVFGALALILAVSGLYGVVAASVARRTRDIGVRMALGGTREVVRAQVLAEGAKLTGLGVAIGLVLALAVARGLSGLVSGLPWLDPMTLGGVALLLSAAALAASWVPAVRATRVDPVRALRAE